MRLLLVFCCLVGALLSGCDREVHQTVVVQANIAKADIHSLWLSETNDCTSRQIEPGWHRDGLWIFRLSSVRGGVGVVTQELTLCYQPEGASPMMVWHSLHGGGAPLIVVSCSGTTPDSCALYMDLYIEGSWVEQPGSGSPRLGP